MQSQPVIAYFSMEIGVDPAMPTYAGGLGVLAGAAGASLATPLPALPQATVRAA